MAIWSGSGLSGSMIAAGAAATLVVAGAVGYQYFGETDAPQDPAPQVEVTGLPETPDPAPPLPEAVPETPMEAAPESETVAEPAPDSPEAPDAAPPVAPRFDLVRVDAAGGAVIAGRAEANADLRLRLDGEEIHQASSDGTGSFVAMLSIPRSDLPQVLSLEMLMEGGSVLVSDQSVIISPTTTNTTTTAAADASPMLPDPGGDALDLAANLAGDAAPATPGTPTAPQLAAPDLPAAPGGQGTVASDAAEPAPATRQTDLAGAPAAQTTATPDAPVVAATDPVAGDSPGQPQTPATPETSDIAALDPDATEAPATGTADPGQPEATAPAETPAVPDAPQADVAAPDAVTDLAMLEADPPGTVDPAAQAPEPMPSGGADTGATAAGAAEATTDSAITAPQPPATDLATAGNAGTPATTETGTAAPEAGTGPTPSEPSVAETDTQATGSSPAPAVTPPALVESGAVETALSGPAPTGADLADAPPAPDVPEAPQAPTVMIADSEGIRVVQTGGPQPQAQVVLDTISYDLGGEVVLAGRGPARSDVRLYLDNQPVQLAQIDEGGGWSTQLPQVDPGTYTLRVDEVSETGDVLSRVETPFLREEPELLATLPQRDGVSVITVQPGHTLWGIARDQLGDGVLYVQVYEANRDLIRDPHWIYPGQIFAIPDAVPAE